ncbi:MAG: outer membrane lipoprotein carrier protein LolA [Candidatus Aminicenantes bacterium]|nr:outer membrane lipoprotein carrier protein LolA [Candidatus Aminicenantes bacterium]
MIKPLIILLLFFFSVSGHESSLLDEVRSTLNNIKPFKVSFVQQVYIDEELEIEESGTILVKDISHLKWIYLNPDLKIFLMQGNTYQFFDKENNQLIIGKIVEEKQRWIWQLLFSEKITDGVKCDRLSKRIIIKKEDEELDFEVFIGNQMLPEKVVQYDTSGAKYIYYFNNYKKRVKIAQKDFQLELPEDVEIIDGNLD